MSESQREAQRTFDALRAKETRTERVTVGLTPSEMDWLDALIDTGMHGRGRPMAMRYLMLDRVRLELDRGTIDVPDRVLAKLSASDGAGRSLHAMGKHAGLPSPLTDPNYLRLMLVEGLRAILVTYRRTDAVAAIAPALRLQPGMELFEAARQIAGALGEDEPIVREWVHYVQAHTPGGRDA